MIESQPKSIWSLVGRWTLLVYLISAFCPFRYCIPSPVGFDNTWFFALNYAAAHGLVMGHDFFWTYGPLTYLLLPFDIGNNLAFGFLTQAALWALFGLSIWLLFFKSGLPLLNLSIFSFFLALTCLNFHQDLYPGNLLLWTAVILIAHHHLRPGTFRLSLSLFFLGLMPLFAFSSALIAALIVAGFCLERMLSAAQGAKKQAIFVLFIPLLTAVLSLRLVLGSFSAISGYMRSGFELGSGYAFAMSEPISPITATVVCLTIALFLSIVLSLQWVDSAHFRFFFLVLTAPIFFELRHALVRPDITHVLQFFSMTALILALVALAVSFARTQMKDIAIVVVLFFSTFWLVDVAGGDLRETFTLLSAIRTPRVVGKILHFSELRHELQIEGYAAMPAAARNEPEITKIVDNESVGFLSNIYSNAFVENLNLSLFPVIERYASYTPFLDQRNADWVASQGPRYLIFDAGALDQRHPWTDAPATWLEVYRWYDTRLLGPRNLLLERRSSPRFRRLEPVKQFKVIFGERITVPRSDAPVFWKMNCPLGVEGRIRALAYAIPRVSMNIVPESGASTIHRVSIPVLQSPSIGNYLPTALSQYAQIFEDRPKVDFVISSIEFSGPGSYSYKNPCEFVFLQAR